MGLPSPTPPANIANTAPRTAIPSVAPIMRAVLTRPDAAPERAAGTLATATAFTGPALRPGPQPITSIAASTNEIAGVDHPLQCGHAGAEPGADLLDGKIHDRRVDLRDQHAERHRQQDQRRAVREAQTRWSKYHCHAGLRGRPLRRSNEETIERAPSSDTTAVAEASTGDMRSRRITFRGGRRFRCEDLG
jgi:hypothetical protein